MTDSTTTANPAATTITTDNTTTDKTVVDPKLAATTTEAKKYKVKINDAEQEVDEAELLRGYQLSKASQAKMQEAAQIKQQATEAIKLMKTNPKLAATHLGIDILKLAKEIMNEDIQEKLLTPEQKKIRDDQKRLKEYEARDKAQKEAADAAEATKLEQHYANDYSNKIITALETIGLPHVGPAGAFVVKRMTSYMLAAMKNGVELDPKDVAPMVKQDYIEEQKALLGGMDDENLISFLGDEFTGRISKAQLKKLQTSQNPIKPIVSNKLQQNKTKNKEMSAKERREQIRKETFGRRR
jgi:hypothetical protein